MESNFRFLSSEYPILANLGILAERYIHDDPNTSLFKMRLFGEKRIETIFEIHLLDFPKEKSLPAKAFGGVLVEQFPIDGDARELPEQIKRAKKDWRKAVRVGR